MNKRKVIKRTVIPISLCATILMSYSAKKILNNIDNEPIEPTTSTSTEYQTETSNIASTTKESAIALETIMSTETPTSEQQTKIKKYSVDEKVKTLCEKNNYSNTDYYYMCNMFHIIEINYNYYYDLFKDDGYLSLSDFEDYIISSLENNKTKLTIYDDSYEEANKYNEILLKNDAAGLYLPNENEVVVNMSIESDTRYMCMFEEIYHSTQTSNKFIYIKDEKKLQQEGQVGMLYQIFFDGPTSEYGTVKNFSNSDEKLIINGLKGSNQCFSGKYYQMLCYLVGFDTMREFNKSITLNDLKQMITSKYNVNGNELIALMLNCQNPSAEELIKVENIFCECMISKVESISNDEQIESMLKKYDYYKNQFALDCSNSIEDYVIYNELENTIIDKCEEYGVNYGKYIEINTRGR